MPKCAQSASKPALASSGSAALARRRAQRLSVRQHSAQERQAEAQVMAHQHAAANSVGYRLCFAIDAWLAA